MRNDEISRVDKYLNSGQVEKAELLLNEIVNRDPNNDTALWFLVKCVEDKDLKFYYLNEILKIKPKDTFARNYIKRLKASLTIDGKITSLKEDSGKKAKKLNAKPTGKQSRVKTLRQTKKKNPSSEIRAKELNTKPASKQSRVKASTPTKKKDLSSDIKDKELNTKTASKQSRVKALKPTKKKDLSSEIKEKT
jgi:hypothetical protein